MELEETPFSEDIPISWGHQMGTWKGFYKRDLILKPESNFSRGFLDNEITTGNMGHRFIRFLRFSLTLPCHI
jgi:hypothetical protein